MPLPQMTSHWPVRPAAQADHVLSMRFQLLQRHMRQLVVAAHVEARVELHQVFIPDLGLCQQNYRRGRLDPFARLRINIPQIHLAADNGLHACACGPHRKLQRGKQVVGVGQRNRRHPHVSAEAGQLFQPHGTFEQGIFGMDAQVNESWICHGDILCRGRRGQNPPSTSYLSKGWTQHQAKSTSVKIVPHSTGTLQQQCQCSPI